MAALEAQKKALPSRAAIWEPNDASAACRVCGGCFTLLKRRHHCRACGLLVCQDCAPSKALMLPSPKRDGTAAMQRACSVCVAGKLPLHAAPAVAVAEADKEGTLPGVDLDSEEEIENERSLSRGDRAQPLLQAFTGRPPATSAAAVWSIATDMGGHLTGHQDSLARHRKL